MYLFASPPKTLSSTNIAAHYLSSGQKILCSLFIRDWCVCSATCLILTGRLSLLSLVKCIYDEYTTTPYIQRTFLIPLYCLVNRIARTSLEIQWDDHYYGGGWRKLQYSHKSSRSVWLVETLRTRPRMFHLQNHLDYNEIACPYRRFCYHRDHDTYWYQ